MNAKDYFDVKRKNNSFFTDNVITELINFINDLSTKKDDENLTREAIASFLGGKVESEREFNMDNQKIKIEIPHPDFTIRDRYVEALYGYFHRLWEEKGEVKTISFAYAYLCILQYHNTVDGQLNINHELPNTNEFDVEEAIKKDRYNANMVKMVSKYKYNKDYINEIFNYCCDEFLNKISLIEFLIAVESANWSNVYCKIENVKCKYIIYSISKNMEDETNWYKKSVESINSTKSRCSGANVSIDWKRGLDNIKSNDKIISPQSRHKV